MLDDDDRRLLRYLQDDPDLSLPDLSAVAGMGSGRASRRLDRLRAAGVLRGSRAVIDWRRLGYTVEVSLRITLDKGAARAFDDFLSAARQVPEVVEIQTFLGRVDARLQVVARDLADYRRLYREAILTLPHIADIESLLTLGTVKSDGRLPL